MIVYTKIISHEQINQFYVMATSFLFHHPNRTLFCQTDIELEQIEGVMYIGRFDDIEEYGDVFCYVSPYMAFLGNVDAFLNQIFTQSAYPNAREEVRNDFYVYTKSSRYADNGQKQDNLLNASLPSYYDRTTIKEYRTYATGCSTLNTREFEPWKVQRNSYKTLIFPWERYYDAMSFAVPYLTDKFIDDVITNCKKHPYMLFYLETGALSWADSSL